MNQMTPPLSRLSGAKTVGFWLIGAVGLLLGPGACGGPPVGDRPEAGPAVEQDLARLQRALPAVRIVALHPQAGEISLSATDGATVATLGEDLRRPFQLATCTVICSYRGAGLDAARAAAATRGCNAVTVRNPATERVPAGTRLHLLATGLDWPTWLAGAGLQRGDFAALVQTDTTQAALRAGGAAAPAADALLTLEPAWPFLDPVRLAALPGFVGAHSAEERAASEGSYYGGGLRAIHGELAAARARGWAGVALSWRAAPDIATDWAWERLAGPALEQAAAWVVGMPGAEVPGSRVWNTALALDRAQRRSGGAGGRVRAVLPLAGLGAEDARALALLPCFSGAEGLELQADEADGLSQPVLTAVLEGLALAKAVEPILGPGQACRDEDPQAALAARRPLVRRVRSSGWQAVMTYDPFWAEAGGARSVLLSGLDGLPGTTVRLPADRQVRLFVLRAAGLDPAAAVVSRPVDAPATDDPLALAALARLARVVPRFHVLDLPATGTVVVPGSAALTIDDLRGVVLDDDPPILGAAPVYAGTVGDGLEPAARVFPARGIAPFRFRHFTNEFNITGRGVAELQDYASAHGFNLIAFRPRAAHPHLPPGSGALNWLSRATPKDLGKDGRYDLLADREDLPGLYASDPYSAPGYQPRSAGTELLMIDIEQPVLDPQRLRQQPWYPQAADQPARTAFEARYYRGFARLYTAAVAAARQAGYPQVSIYGWYLVRRTWWGLEKLRADPAADWEWNAYGRLIYPLVDLIHPSVYCFYVAAQNVAYTLANLDLTRSFIEALPERKPMRPYYWLKYHGGGASGLNWWANQPIVDEEVRAMHALAFFTGIDGLDTWDWLSDQRFAGIPDPAEDQNLVVGQPFACAPEGGGPARRFHRYDVLHVLACDQATGATRFQLIRQDQGPGYGVGDGQPVYRLPRPELRRHLRPWLENAAAMFEGLALVHPFEYLLRQGTVQVDVSAQEQFARTLPIVRRVRLGRHHVVITYDPNVLYARLAATGQSGVDAGTDHHLPVNSGAAGKGIELRDFAGHPGLTLHLPADDQPRIFVLRDR